MDVIDELLRESDADVDLLIKNAKRGDNYNISRDIEFFLESEDEERIRHASEFIEKNRNGRTTVQKGVLDDGTIEWSLIVCINAPTRMEVICTLSAYMVCLAHLFNIEYTGWGCVIQRDNSIEEKT